MCVYISIICACIHMHIFTSCIQRQPESNDILVSPRCRGKIHAPVKELGFLGEMADSRTD